MAFKRRFRHTYYLAVITFGVLIFGFQNCAKESFSQVKNNGSTTSTTPLQALTANDLTFATNVNVQLAIQISDILGGNTAPAGQSLSLVSVGSSSLGTLAKSGNAYNFNSSTTGTSTFSYTIKDSAGDVASATITVKVLGPDSATGAFYACDDQGDLYVLDPFQGTLQSLVTIKYNGALVNINDLAMDASATLYGRDDSNNIYTINVNTGAATLLVSNLIPSSVVGGGLTILPSGNFVTAENSFSNYQSSVVSVKPGNKATTTLVSANKGYSMREQSQNLIIGDIKYLPDGFLYWTVTNPSTKMCANNAGPGTQGIVRVDPNSGATTEMFCLSEPNVSGLGYANHSLYGFSNGGDLIEVNLNTGATTIINSTGKFFSGGASNPALW